MKKIILLLACVSLISGGAAFAQTLKIGYLNSTELLMLMPERVKADSAWQKYAKAFSDEIETMQKDLQTKIQAYQSSEKTMTDAMKEVKAKEIQDLQQRIETVQQSAQEKVQQKKQELYAPVLDKADKAIKEVAKEKNYDYIFDVTQGILYVKEGSGNDIMPLVKAKLGLKDAPASSMTSPK
jgi:outer membrane protein